MVPEFIDPKKRALEHQSLEGAIPLMDFHRARDLLKSQEGKLHFNWVFKYDERHHIVANLHLKADVHLQCQRCQAPLVYHLNVEIPMEVVYSEEQAERLPLVTQPLYVDEAGKSKAFQVLEDELILNLPDFPRHEKNACEVPQNKAYYQPSSNGKSETYKPFANLKEKL